METVPPIFMELMFLALKSIFRNKTLEVPFRAFKRGRYGACSSECKGHICFGSLVELFKPMYSSEYVVQLDIVLVKLRKHVFCIISHFYNSTLGTYFRYSQL